MDYNQVELRRETLFKDAVLSAAETRSMEIISEAQQKSAQEIAAAKRACKEADHDVIAQGLARDAEREHSALLQQARRELLQHRTQLVDELFAQLRQRLASFAAGDGYAAWLQAKVEKHKADIAGVPVVIHLRPADMRHADELQQALPGSTVQPSGAILLGGLTITAGKLLYNETLDAALEAEKEQFYKNSSLRID